ncbi:MAG: LamG-like jellyroll fold domain-containing protein [Bacteroidota bacterium]
MKRILSSALIIFCAILFLPLNTNAQEDTTWVQTLTFDDITQRRGVWTFPDGSETWRKILMIYTLKCDPATTADGFDCGEWDYLTYNTIHHHTGDYDSVRQETGRYYMDGEYVDPLRYVDSPVYNYYDEENFAINYTSTISESVHGIGSGVGVTELPFRTSSKTARTQHLWAAAELTGAGMAAGSIDKISFDVETAGYQLDNLTIRMKHTSANTLSAFESDNFQTVYDLNSDITTTGTHTFNLTYPFNWDGSSNIIVEFVFENNTTGSDNLLTSTGTGFNVTVAKPGVDRYLDVLEGEWVEIALNDYDFGNEITVSFWTNGDVDLLPKNTSVFEARDSVGNRLLNVHLPWSNSQIYWDAGTESGYDRINQPATNSEIEGNWVHWTFTKNATTGWMRIYKNGVEWLSGNNRTREVGIVNSFRLGNSVLGNYTYAGKIDEFRVWDKELDQATIAEWMDKDLDNSHPDINDLVVYYTFNDNGTIEDKSGNNHHGMPTSAGLVKPYEVEDEFRNFVVSTIRPNIEFTQGEYTSTLTPIITSVTEEVSPVTIAEYAVSGRKFVINDITFGWPEGDTYNYDVNGSIQNTISNPANVVIVNDSIFYHESPFEIIDNFEIGRFITPYGIGLSLGNEGFTWTYDVTDYAHLLKGEVDMSAGNNQELIDVKFMMIEGTPPREIKEVTKIWGDRRSYSYHSLDDDVNLSNVTVPLNPEASTFKVRTRLTGHGHNSNTGSYPHCCEWRDNTHYLYVNGGQIADWHIWQTHDCALNPVFPQGGTWLGSREGWCPGDVVKDNDFEITQYVDGSTIDIDYGITPVPVLNQGMGNGNYVVAMQLMQYGAFESELDAELYDIISPNDNDYYSRMNPICNDPRIVIRNSGSQTLTTLDINYWVSGGSTETYAWTGNLDPMQTQEVTLPIPDVNFWVGDGGDVFYVNLTSPNGGTDGNTANSVGSSSFEVPRIFPFEEGVRLEFKTNNRPSENSLWIRDMDGNVVHSWTGLSANTTYDTMLELPDGCYTMELLDTGNDGLSYWADPAAGGGFIRYWHPVFPLVIESWDSEFGRSIHFPFFMGDFSTPTEDILDLSMFTIHPNPSTGRFDVEINGVFGQTRLELTDALGQLILSENADLTGIYNKTFDNLGLSNGVYFMSLKNGDNVLTRKLVISN